MFPPISSLMTPDQNSATPGEWMTERMTQHAWSVSRFEDYNRIMQNIPRFMPLEPSFLEIEVIPNDADQTFQTNLQCSRNRCGKTVVIDSHGPSTVQSISCPQHGFLTSFPHQNALGEFVRFLANKILAASGHELIEDGATSVFGEDDLLPDSVN
jgi:hypothetical protein